MRLAIRLEDLAADIIRIPLETRFLAVDRQRGNGTINGLGMLLHQGRPGDPQKEAIALYLRLWLLPARPDERVRAEVCGTTLP